MTLEVIWYLVIIACLICYSMLDGFDLGVGMLHPFVKTDVERRTLLNAIGPVWDGNEVWLVVVGGALFAGFPEAFATLFSSFYIPTMALLAGLMFRAVSIEFRSKRASNTWRQFWDYLFSIGSFGIAFGIGVVLGNIIEGLPLNQTHDFTGEFSLFLRPYGLLIGLTTVALFMMHGSIYLAMKTDGPLHEKMRTFVTRCILFFVAVYITLSIVTILFRPFMLARMWETPILFLIPLAAFCSIFSVPLLIRRKWDGRAFLASCASIALLLSLFALGTYPYLIRSTVDPATNSLFIANSASSELTLTVLLIIVAIGVPMVLGYGFYIYRIFRGKVHIDDHSY